MPIINNFVNHLICDYEKQAMLRKVILFDVGGVLLKWKDQWLFDEISKQSKIPFDRIKDHFNANISELFEGKITEKQFWKKIPGANQIHPKIISKTFHRLSKPDDQILNLAYSLKKQGFETGILSNITPETRQILPKKWTYEFDHVFFSDQIKLSKPDSKIFSYVTERLSNHEIIFIDDKKENISAAKKHGIYSILFGEYQSLKYQIMKKTSIVL